ncbi:MAG: FtsX-like permease family protein [Saprospiraceae bacterium]|nr:FtsX-like permease family protein [Saprospiraceae bacterium]
MSSIILGIAALVAINSFNYNLLKDIDREAAGLLGADLAVTGNRPLGPNSQKILDSLEANQASEVEMLSMAYFPDKGTSQFVRIKALDGSFPFYGRLETSPAEAAHSFQVDQSALVDETLMLEQNLKIGDRLKLGEESFVISGSLKAGIGNVGLTSSFAPMVYIGQQYIQKTGLIQPGSLINYSYYYLVDPTFPIDVWKEERVDEFRKESMSMETIGDRQANVSDAFNGLYNFLNLVALVALLLGCIGVASSVFIYIKSKIPAIAIFRCLGLKPRDAFFIYFFQILIVGAISVIVGASLGSLVQVLLPEILDDFLPFEVAFQISWKAILEGILIGLSMTLLFSLLPLLSAKNISPMRTLRLVDNPGSKWSDRWNLVIYLAIALSLILFLLRMTGDWKLSLYFTLGLFGAFVLLFAVAQLIIILLRRYFPRQWSFELRQGISNLYRPNNQTAILLVSIGLGTAVLTTLFIVQGFLLKNVESMDAGNQPNMFFFGIESSQKDSLAQLVSQRDMPLIQQLPIVTMRLEGWKGKSKSDWLSDTTRAARGWAIHRESRVTYRNYLDDNEKLIRGDFNKTADGVSDSIFISLATSYSEAMDIDLGDELVFNVQGAMLRTYVGSIRKIDNANMRARFLILFPPGILEDAPQFHVLVTKSPDPATTAEVRNLVVKTFPNVSVIDLGMVLETIREILTKVSYIIQFMAVFCILTGLVVLLSSLLLSKYQRIKESVLLRTLGASKQQINRINITEYFLLGTLSALTGTLIAISASYLIARFQMELEFHLNWIPVIIMFVSVVVFTVLIGLLNSREIVNKAPLEVLRKEVG